MNGEETTGKSGLNNVCIVHSSECMHGRVGGAWAVNASTAGTDTAARSKYRCTDK